MSIFVPPSEPDATVSRVPTRPPPLSDEQATKLSTLLEHLNSPTFALPGTVKEVRSAQKQRYKKVKEFKSWVGAPLNLDKAPCTPLTDREKYFLTTDRELASLYRRVRFCGADISVHPKNANDSCGLRNGTSKLHSREQRRRLFGDASSALKSLRKSQRSFLERQRQARRSLWAGISRTGRVCTCSLGGKTYDTFYPAR